MRALANEKARGLRDTFVNVFFVDHDIKNANDTNAYSKNNLPQKQKIHQPKREPGHVRPSPPPPLHNPNDEVSSFPSGTRSPLDTQCFPKALYLGEQRHIQCSGDQIRAGTKLLIDGEPCLNQTNEEVELEQLEGLVGEELKKNITYQSWEIRCTPKFKKVGLYGLSLRQDEQLFREHLQYLTVYNKFKAVDDYAQLAPHSEVSLNATRNDEGAHTLVIEISEGPMHGTVEFDATSMRYKNTDGTAESDELTYTAQDLFGNRSSAKVRFEIVRNGILEFIPKYQNSVQTIRKPLYFSTISPVTQFAI
jgi:hypothetical protein